MDKKEYKCKFCDKVFNHGYTKNRHELNINFCVDSLTTSANSGNFLNCKFEHSKIFSKQRHPNSQIVCDATCKNKDVKSKTTNMISTNTNMLALKIKCSYYNHSKQMLYTTLSKY